MTQTLAHAVNVCPAGKPLVVRFQSDAGTGGLLDAVDRLSPLPSELPGGPGWAGGIPRPAMSPSDSDNVRLSPHAVASMECADTPSLARSLSRDGFV